MLAVDEWLEEEWDDVAQLLMSVHDSFEWQAEDSERGREVSHQMIKMFEDVQGPPFNLLVPFLVEANDGVNWAEATFGETG